MLLHIRPLMEKSGITSKCLADCIGCTEAQMSFIVNGKTFPSEDRIRQIAQVLDVPVYMLFVDQDEDLPKMDNERHSLHCPHCGKRIVIAANKW